MGRLTRYSRARPGDSATPNERMPPRADDIADFYHGPAKHDYWSRRFAAHLKPPCQAAPSTTIRLRWPLLHAPYSSFATTCASRAIATSCASRFRRKRSAPLSCYFLATAHDFIRQSLGVASRSYHFSYTLISHRILLKRSRQLYSTSSAWPSDASAKATRLLSPLWRGTCATPRASP